MKLVKQLTTAFISVVMVALLSVNVFAYDEAPDRKYIMDAHIISIINDQLSDAEISAFKTSGIPELVSDEQFRSDAPVLKILNEVFS